ncbi:MAG: DUF86 domain-containing protein [Phycisphaerae bacterium]|nr:DUF86 domain-containing protein [Phycisphaerae bacterium]
MRQPDDLRRLRDMLDHAREAVEMSADASREDLDSDRKLCLALIRLVEIIGEAAARVSQDTRDARPDVRWSDIIGMRNRMIHAYDDVDLDILWDVADLHLPPLIMQIESIIAELSD